MLHASFYDPYLDEMDQTVLYSNTMQRPDDVAVEHYVSLADAWASGADAWDAQQRLAFANNRDNLAVVSLRTSQDRAGADAAGWMPADESAACLWARGQIGVKQAYDLAVDELERKALERALAGC